MVTSVLEDPSGYGRVVRDRAGAVVEVVETKKDGDASAEQLQIREVNAGIYAFDASALRDALPRLSAENSQSELYLPQVLDVMRESGGTVATHPLDDPSAMLGVNDRAALARVRKLAQLAIHRRHLLAGHSYLVDCVLEDGARVGPFAYLRPDARLRAGVKVGTFVEVKNSDIGAGAKVPHLSYIGDADVGERTNLGAGTITANYDGQHKHRTTIGSDVHGGVDTSFVAPVTVGDDAWTAAGSVVTDDVPDGALAVARAKQENVEDYAERRKRRLHSEGR
jgi:bifunctional UDP-N-acetylglucosamine pyrophosphorylase/glucosamine-1-phosphate N-acetyltransferase